MRIIGIDLGTSNSLVFLLGYNDRPSLTATFKCFVNADKIYQLDARKFPRQKQLSFL